MIETKFTTGPWFGMDENGQFNGNHEWSASDENEDVCTSEVAPIWSADRVIALVVHSSSSFYARSHPSIKANAHLIAAAPDMYEELECARDVFRFYQSQHEFKGGTEKAIRNKEIADRIDRLLAKARGQE